jgi:hypothetical protein
VRGETVGVGARQPDHVGVLIFAEEQISQIQGVADGEGGVSAVAAASLVPPDVFQDSFFVFGGSSRVRSTPVRSITTDIPIRSTLPSGAGR